MDSRGNPRPATISRRSCDQCRSRKIGCDRSSPCSNCVSARMECTHSTRAVKSTEPRQRVLISSQYEQKIDDIARDIGIIKSSLHGSSNETVFNKHNLVPKANVQARGTTQDPSRDNFEHIAKRPRLQSAGETQSASSWDHPVQIVDFVKSVAGSDASSASDGGLIGSLKNLLQAMSNPPAETHMHSFVVQSEPLPIPPLNAVLPLLRWVKTHQNFHRVQWISQVLPAAMFEDICRKVYFAVDDYTDADYILTLGFLSYMFSEHKVSTGAEDSGEYSQMCREAFSDAVSKLPLTLPSTLEVVATLLMATLYSIESSNSTKAWIYISSAVSHCQTLRLHRLQQSAGAHPTVGNDLFLSVYKFEKGLSLRLGRPSSIRDSEIEMPLASSENRSTKIARIQGQIYDELYSHGGLTDSQERGALVKELAREVKDVINQIELDLASPSRVGGDTMRELYLQADLVCHTSILTSILRALPPAFEDPSISSEYVVAARAVFDIHEQCMVRVRQSNDPPTIARYLNWAILHVPFVPFSILFGRVVQFSDLDDLDRLGRFAQSLKPDYTSDADVSATHPYRLYDLLYKTARLYVESGQKELTTVSSSEATIVNGLGTPQKVHVAHTTEYVNELGDFDPMFGAFDTSTLDLGEWFQGNQQLFHLLDEGAPF